MATIMLLLMRARSLKIAFVTLILLYVFFNMAVHASNRCLVHIDKHVSKDTLDLSECKLNQTIKKILLNGTNIDDEKASLLAKNTSIINMDLRWNSIQNAGAFALAKNNTLKALSISENSIQAEGIKALETSNIIALSIGYQFPESSRSYTKFLRQFL